MPAWTIDDSKQRSNYDRNKHIPVPASSMKKYFTWKALIANNTPPMQAAKEVGDLHFEELSGKLKGEYTIRISQEHRVAFKIDQGTSTVTVFSIGGHYPKAKK